MNTGEWNLYEEENNKKLKAIKEELIRSYETKNVGAYKKGLRDMEKAYNLYSSTTFPHFKKLILDIMEENPQFELNVATTGGASRTEEFSFLYKGVRFMKFSGSLHDSFYQRNLTTTGKEELKKKLDEAIQEKHETEKYIKMVSSMLDNPKIIFDESFRKEMDLNTEKDDWVNKLKLFFETQFSYRSLLKEEVRGNMNVSISNNTMKLEHVEREIKSLTMQLNNFEEVTETVKELEILLPDFIKKYNFETMTSVFV